MTSPDTAPFKPSDADYQAAIERARKANLKVQAVWDAVRERTCWHVTSDHSTHIVQYQPDTNVLTCDCESRKYCRCRAAVHEYLTAEAMRTSLKRHQAQVAAAERDAAPLMLNTAPTISWLR